MLSFYCQMKTQRQCWKRAWSTLFMLNFYSEMKPQRQCTFLKGFMVHSFWCLRFHSEVNHSDSALTERVHGPLFLMFTFPQWSKPQWQCTYWKEDVVHSFWCLRFHTEVNHSDSALTEKRTWSTLFDVKPFIVKWNRSDSALTEREHSLWGEAFVQ